MTHGTSDVEHTYPRLKLHSKTSLELTREIIIFLDILQ